MPGDPELVDELEQSPLGKVEHRSHQHAVIGQGAPPPHATQAERTHATAQRHEHRLELVIGVVGRQHRRRTDLDRDLRQRVVPQPPRGGRTIARLPRRMDITSMELDAQEFAVGTH
jgi:hypothetical protein